MAIATYQPALSSFGSHLGRPFQEQALLEKRGGRRQGVLLRSRSKTAPSPREQSYHPIDSATGGIGESPRSSYSSLHRHSSSQDRHNIGKFLNLNTLNTSSVPTKVESTPQRSHLTMADHHPMSVQASQNKIPSPSRTKWDSRDRISADRYTVSFAIYTKY
jgi:hypothetical protein